MRGNVYILSLKEIDLNKKYLLNREERAKANRFVYPKDRDNYITSHIYLREKLTSYAPHILPQDWEFEFNQNGKPQIAQKHRVELYFNLSHTQSMVAVVVSVVACGIDIEEESQKEFQESLLSMVLSPNEQKLYGEGISFYLFWTLKEAYLKTLGEGIVEEDLTQLDFSPWIEQSRFIFRGVEMQKQERDGVFLAFGIKI